MIGVIWIFGSYGLGWGWINWLLAGIKQMGCLLLAMMGGVTGLKNLDKAGNHGGGIYRISSNWKQIIV